MRKLEVINFEIQEAVNKLLTKGSIYKGNINYCRSFDILCKEDSISLHCCPDHLFSSVHINVVGRRILDTLDDLHIESNNKKYKMPKRLRNLIEEYLKALEDWKNVDPSRYKLIDYDENGEVVPIEKWYDLIDKIDTSRPLGESRAVVVNEQYVCPSAASAIRHLDCFEDFRNGKSYRNPTKDGDLFYKACDGKNYFKGVSCRYATKEDILSILKGML